MNPRELIVRALALQTPAESPLPFRLGAAIFLFHLGGLLGVARLAHWPPLVTLAVLLTAILSSLNFRRPQLSYGLRFTHYALALAPLSLAYFVAALRILIALIARAQGITSGSLTVPEPWGGWLNLNWAVAFGGLWAAAARLPQARRGQALALGLGALAFGWAGFVYFCSAPAGVTGSDPYAYVQMAVDLAERGTLLHAFPLAKVARGLGLPLYPVAHVGYRPPGADNLSATVWPPGFSVLLAGAYRLAGERGLYLLNPALGLGSLAATAWLAKCLFPRHPQHRLVGALAALWLATSPEQTTRLLVPLADVAAQLFTTLTLCLTLHVTNYGLRFTFFSRRALPPLLAGLAFGWAYFARYTQLLIAPGILYLAWTGLAGRRRRFTFLALFGMSALAVAVPDLLYHQQAFGSPFRVGSEELGLFRLGAVPATAAQLAREAFAPAEFLAALPFLALGAAAMRRDRASGRQRWIALAFSFGPLVLFHLPYPYLRLRDLLPVFPALAVLGAFGAVEAAGWLLMRSNPARLAAIALILAAPLARWRDAWPFAEGFYTFGYLNAEQRDALGRLDEVAPPGAVIAASLNSGAVELYSGRGTVRPADWSAAEFEVFLRAMEASGREVYLLADGEELAPVVERLRAEGRLHKAAVLPGVYFEAAGGGSRNLDLTLYRIEEG